MGWEGEGWWGRGGRLWNDTSCILKYIYKYYIYYIFLEGLREKESERESM